MLRTQFKAWSLIVLMASSAQGQLLDVPIGNASEAETTTLRFRVGAIINAKRGACRDILAIVAVPIECDEQSVQIIEEDFSPQVQQVVYRDVAGGEARQMVISIPYLEAGAEARAAVTLEVRTRTTPPLEGEETVDLTIPRRVAADLRRFVAPSPFIESKNAKIKKLSRSILADFDPAPKATDEERHSEDWLRIEALYDYVLDTVAYIEGPDTSAVTTLRDGSADCHGRSALFVALCRTLGVPARMVWVHNHCYPEFYLEDADGNGRWLPAESAGTRAFGEMPLARTIMQKGDNFRIPEKPRDRLRYATDYLTGRPVAGGGKPSVKYLREVVGD